MEREYLSYAEAADLTGLPLGTLYSMVSRRQIPHLRLAPRTVRFDRRQLEAWLDASAVSTGPETRISTKQTPSD